MIYLFSSDFVEIMSRLRRLKRDGIEISKQLLLLSSPLDNGRKSFRALSYWVRQFELSRYHLEESLEALLQERKLHILVSSPQKQVYLYPVALKQPLGCSFCLEVHVVFAGAYLDLDAFRLRSVGFGLYFAAFLLLLVLEFTILHDFCNRWLGQRGDFYKVQIQLPGLCEGLTQGKNPKVFAFGPYYAYFCCANLLINSGSIQNVLLKASILQNWQNGRMKRRKIGGLLRRCVG